MGFMDKAKKLAEQAQTKLDDAQKQFNERQSDTSASQGPPVEYDKHGRPTDQEEPAPAAAPPPAASTAPPPAAPPPAPPAAPQGETEEDANKPDYAPPKLSSGDPLAG